MNRVAPGVAACVLALAGCGKEESTGVPVPPAATAAAQAPRTLWPEDARQMLDLGNSRFSEAKRLEAQGKWEESRAAYEAALKAYQDLAAKYPDNDAAFFGQQMAYAKLGDEEGVKQAREQIKRLTGTEPMMHPMGNLPAGHPQVGGQGLPGGPPAGRALPDGHPVLGGAGSAAGAAEATAAPAPPEGAR
jgi:hypothetical protein